MPVGCEARQYSDQMVCARCDLAWDVNDMDPPPCKLQQAAAKLDAARKPGGVLYGLNKYWRAKHGN